MSGGIALKKPFTVSMNAFTQQAIADNNQMLGQALPCHVVDVNGSIVTVAFDVTTKQTLPQVTCPVLESIYIRLPIQVGDKGITIPASVSLSQVAGLGASAPPSLSTPANLSALIFVPIGSSTWASINPNAVVITAPNSGPIILNATNVIATQNLSAGNGLTGTFTTGTGQTVQVDSGIITNIF